MKKLLVTFFVAITLVFVMSIASSAETKISENNIDESGDIVAKVEYNVTGYQNYYSVDITYDTIDGTTKSGKFYYVTNNGLYKNMLQLEGVFVPSDFDLSQMVYLFDKADINGNGEYSYDEFLKGSSGGGTSSNPSMQWQSYESFDNTTGQFSGEMINIRPTIQALSYSKYMVYFGHNFLCTAGSLKTVTYNGKEAVDGTFYISPTVNEIMSNTFGGDGSSSNVSEKTPDYKRLVFEAREGSVSMGQYTFCRGVVEEVVFLSGKYSFHGKESIAFQMLEGTSTGAIGRIVVQEGTSFPSGSISWNVGNYDIVYIDDESSYDASKYSSALVNLTGNVIYEELCYVYGHYNDSDDFDCTTKLVCQFAEDGCDYVIAEASDGHILTEKQEYVNGYTQSGTKTNACTRDGCKHATVTTLGALFTSKGYSKDTTSSAIVFDIKVDNEAILAYEKYLKSIDEESSILYGVVVAVQATDDKPLNDDATAKAGALAINFNENNYSKIQIKITGIDESNYETGVYCSGYVYTNNKITYINGATTAETATKVTYASLPSEE